MSDEEDETLPLFSPAYYARTNAYASDGSPTFATEDDRAAQEAAAITLGQAFHCTFRPFGHLSPIDWFAERHGRVVAVAEFKTRSHARGFYPTVFLNVRKWIALQLASIGLGVPAFFVVQFTDELCYTGLPATGHISIAGCSRMVKAISDVEPVFEIPVETLTTVRVPR